MGTTTDNQALPYPWEVDGVKVADFKALADAIDAKVNSLKASLDLGRKRPSFQVYNGTWDNLTFAGGATGITTFTSVLWDTTGGWNLGTSATTWTVPAGLGGKWWFHGSAYTGNGDTSLTSGAVILQKNAADASPRRQRRYAWGNVFYPDLATEITLVAGDTIRLAFTASGAGTARITEQTLEAYRVSL